MRVWWILLLLVAPAAAQVPEPGPEVVVLVYHPFPDDADILGFAYGPDCSRACDAFVVRHGGSAPFTDGIAFPGFVADGVLRREGLGDGPAFAATLDMYESAVQDRLTADTPLTLSVATRVLDTSVRASVWLETDTNIAGGLRMWAALVEDPVHYRPPAALSNGVYEHPFTVRAVRDLGSIALTAGVEERVDLDMPVDAAWDTAKLRIAVWVEQDRAALGTFDPGETVQAVSHVVSAGGVTRQEDRAVLVEAYSASWCDPCLIGDEALEEVAQMHGLPTGRSLSDADPSYIRDGPIPMPVLLVAGLIGAALFALARIGERP